MGGIYDIISSVANDIGMSPSGKARDFDSRTRRFKSGHPSQTKGIAIRLCLLFGLRIKI